MNEQSEKLSTLMDEYQESEQDQALLDSVLKDVNQKYVMHRYQMIGEVMRNEMPESIKLDFASSVMAKIEQEPILKQDKQVASKNSQQPSWLWSVLFKPVAGLAVAVTVAVIAVSNLQLKPDAVESADRLAAIDSSSAKVEQLASIPLVSSGLSNVSVNSRNVTASNPGMNWKIKRDRQDVQQKLNVYLINHNEFSNSWQGIIPQVRVVGFDAKK